MNKTVLFKIEDHFKPSAVKEYKKGQIIIMDNQDPPGVFYLIEGTVEQYDITPDGNKVAVNLFKPPAFFPMSWAINKTPNSYFFAALTDVKLKQASADDTVALLKSNPDVTYDLLSRVYKGTDALLQRLVLATSSMATNRLMFELLIEARRLGKKIDPNKALIKVKQSSLAARSGLARETVSREIHKLESENLINLTAEGIEIDMAALEKRLDSATDKST